MTKDKPRKKYKSNNYTTPELRQKYRAAFAAVLETLNNTRSVLGQSRAIDYSKVIGGEGAQFSQGDIGHQLIDYTVDVLKAVKDTLSEAELKFFNENLLDDDYDMTVQSEEFLRLQERLGRVFISRDLFPVSKYFIAPNNSKELLPISYRRRTHGHEWEDIR